jgi:hypothetical protein
LTTTKVRTDTPRHGRMLNCSSVSLTLCMTPPRNKPCRLAPFLRSEVVAMKNSISGHVWSSLVIFGHLPASDGPRSIRYQPSTVFLMARKSREKSRKVIHPAAAAAKNSILRHEMSSNVIKCHFRRVHQPSTLIPQLTLTLRISDFLRVSDFGSRVSPPPWVAPKKLAKTNKY